MGSCVRNTGFDLEVFCSYLSALTNSPPGGIAVWLAVWWRETLKWIFLRVCLFPSVHRVIMTMLQVCDSPTLTWTACLWRGSGARNPQPALHEAGRDYQSTRGGLRGYHCICALIMLQRYPPAYTAVYEPLPSSQGWARFHFQGSLLPHLNVRLRFQETNP
jgi:hypothetical protein